MELRAAIFDLNGTLVDDIAYHYRAWKALADRHGFAMDEAIFQSINGFKNEDIFPRLMGGDVDPARMNVMAEEKETMYRELYRPHLAPLRGAEPLFERLHAAGVKLAVASSAPARNRELVIDGLGWNDRFDLVVANENLRGKPAPDIFLAAATRLGIPTSECLVFEDAVNGVLAAQAAGITCVGVTTNVGADELRDAGAVLTVADFDGLPEDLDRLLG
jgi:beta-phosphoglucomutase family hydrolase